MPNPKFGTEIAAGAAGVALGAAAAGVAHHSTSHHAPPSSNKYENTYITEYSSYGNQYETSREVHLPLGSIIDTVVMTVPATATTIAMTTMAPNL